MGNSLLTQLGVGGILIYLFIKELFAFLKVRNGNNRNEPVGQMNIDAWEASLRRIVMEAIDHEFNSRKEGLRAMIREELRYFYGLGRKGGWEDPMH